MLAGVASHYAQKPCVRRRVRRQLLSVASVSLVAGGVFDLRDPGVAAARSDRLSHRGRQPPSYLAVVRNAGLSDQTVRYGAVIAKTNLPNEAINALNI